VRSDCTPRTFPVGFPSACGWLSEKVIDRLEKGPSKLVLFCSGVECKDEIYSSSQLASVKTENSCKNTSAAETVLPVVVVEKVADETGPFKKSDLVKNRGELLPSYSETGAPKPPLTATSKIFAPRTEEMNKGFLTFSDDEPGLTSKLAIRRKNITKNSLRR
jgi:hypothetical protein